MHKMHNASSSLYQTIFLIKEKHTLFVLLLIMFVNQVTIGKNVSI